MKLPEDVSQGLVMEFSGGRTYVISPPAARVAIRVRAMMGEMEKAEQAGEKLQAELAKWEAALEADPEYAAPQPVAEYVLDMDKLAAKMGIDPADYNLNEDLLGDMYNQLLDELDIDEFDIATQAMYIWSTAGREAAETFLQDPTQRPNRAQRRATKKRKKATSR